MNPPTKAAARSPYTRTTTPRWRSRVGLPAPSRKRRASGSSATRTRISDVARRPVGQQRDRRLVPDPRAHLGLEVQPAALARDAVERPVAQPAQRRQLASRSRRARCHWSLAGLHARVHVEQRVGRHEVAPRRPAPRPRRIPRPATRPRAPRRSARLRVRCGRASAARAAPLTESSSPARAAFARGPPTACGRGARDRRSRSRAGLPRGGSARAGGSRRRTRSPARSAGDR